MIHIPASSVNLKDSTYPQIRLGLQGAPCTGKTTSAMTFPNPYVLAFEPGLVNYAGKDIPHAPFHDHDWMMAYDKGNFSNKAIPKAFPNRKEALLHFLQNDALKFGPEQTLILDSWTAIQAAFDFQTELPGQQKITKEGKIDDYDFWKKKIEFSERIMIYLYSVKCHVVVIFHEHQVRDKNTGQLTEKIAPLMEGKFVQQVKRHFTDFFRCVVEEEKDKEGKVVKSKYHWQVKSDNKFDARCRLDVPDGQFYIEPTFASFNNYPRIAPVGPNANPTISAS